MFKKLSISVVLLTTALLLTACGGNSGAKTDKPVKPAMTLSEKARSLDSEISCTTSAGQWKKVGKLQQPACVLTTSDSGKACTDSSQCQVACYANNGRFKPGSAVTGQCNSSTNVFGCNTIVKDGKVEGTLCID